MSPVPARLKELRERSGLSIRDVAEALRYSSHNKYRRYETADYKKDELPLPLARRLAGIFQRGGVRAEDVLALAGLGVEELDAETRRLPDLPTTLMLPVALPSERALTRALEGMLETMLRLPQDEIAKELARALPSVLASALASNDDPESDVETDPEEGPPPPSKAPRSKQKA